MAKRKPGANKKSYRRMPTETQLKAAFFKHAGLVCNVAKSLGVTSRWIYYQLEDSEELQEALAESRERQIDVAEDALFKQIKRGNIAAIIFFLKTQGRSRGYIERFQAELDGKIQTTVQSGPSPAEVVRELMANDDFIEFCRESETHRVSGLLRHERQQAAGSNGHSKGNGAPKVDPGSPPPGNGQGGNGRDPGEDS